MEKSISKYLCALLLTVSLWLGGCTLGGNTRYPSQAEGIFLNLAIPQGTNQVSASISHFVIKSADGNLLAQNSVSGQITDLFVSLPLSMSLTRHLVLEGFDPSGAMVSRQVLSKLNIKPILMHRGNVTRASAGQDAEVVQISDQNTATTLLLEQQVELGLGLKKGSFRFGSIGSAGSATRILPDTDGSPRLIDVELLSEAIQSTLNTNPELKTTLLNRSFLDRARISASISRAIHSKSVQKIDPLTNLAEILWQVNRTSLLVKNELKADSATKSGLLSETIALGFSGSLSVQDRRLHTLMDTIQNSITLMAESPGLPSTTGRIGNLKQMLSSPSFRKAESPAVLTALDLGLGLYTDLPVAEILKLALRSKRLSSNLCSIFILLQQIPDADLNAEQILFKKERIQWTRNFISGFAPKLGALGAVEAKQMLLDILLESVRKTNSTTDGSRMIQNLGREFAGSGKDNLFPVLLDAARTFLVSSPDPRDESLKLLMWSDELPPEIMSMLQDFIPEDEITRFMNENKGVVLIKIEAPEQVKIGQAFEIKAKFTASLGDSKPLTEVENIQWREVSEIPLGVDFLSPADRLKTVVKSKISGLMTLEIEITLPILGKKVSRIQIEVLAPARASNFKPYMRPSNTVFEGRDFRYSPVKLTQPVRVVKAGPS